MRTPEAVLPVLPEEAEPAQPNARALHVKLNRLKQLRHDAVPEERVHKQAVVIAATATVRVPRA
jgi:hypothetical protein